MTRRISFGLVAVMLVVLIAGLAFAALKMRSGVEPGRIGPLVGSSVGGPFSLVDQDGTGRPAPARASRGATG